MTALLLVCILVAAPIVEGTHVARGPEDGRTPWSDARRAGREARPEGRSLASRMALGDQAGRGREGGRPVLLAVPGPVLRGRASWYGAQGLTAAAGPALRDWLGRGWRGTTVRVSAGGRSVVLQVTDWCQCYKGERRERVIDLSDEAFRQLAPLSTGIVNVTVSRLELPATDAP